MKKRLSALRLIIAAILYTSLFSCSKNKDSIQNNPIQPIQPPRTDDSITYTMNPYYRASSTTTNSKYELIISSSAGKVIVDTLAEINASASISFKTAEKLIDVTIIVYNKALSRYFIETYKGVAPSQWDTLTRGPGSVAYRIPIASSSSTPSRLYYKNVPTLKGGFYFNSYASYTGSGWSGGYSPGQISVDYSRHVNTPAYLVFPSMGLYNLYYPAKSPDTVSLAHMDTLVQVNFQKPAAYDLVWLDLLGLIDSTDFSRVIDVYNDASTTLGSTVSADLLYPGKHFQTYQLTIWADNHKGGHIEHFSYGDSLTTVLNFPDETNYSIESSMNNNFAVKFKNVRPTYYSTSWSSGNIYFSIMTSPDSTKLNPLGMITSLQAQSYYLKGFNFSNLALKGFEFENVKNVNFETYINYFSNSKLRTRRIVYYSDRYGKTF